MSGLTVRTRTKSELDSLQTTFVEQDVPGLLRLDWPAEGLTLLQDTLKLCGRLAIRGAHLEEQHLPDLELLIEPLDASLGNFASGLRMLAQRIPLEMQSPGVRLLRMESLPSETFGQEEVTATFSAIQFEAEIDLSSFVPESGEEPRIIWLSVATSLHDYQLVSNSLPISIPPREMRAEAFGGLYSPQQGLLYSDFLDVSGWAFCSGEQVREVRIRVNGKEIAQAAVGLKSKHAAELFPGVSEAERARFLLTLSRQQLLDCGLSLRALSSQLIVEAVVYFATGRELTLRAMPLSWQQPKGSIAAPQPQASIERIAPAGTDGGIAIEGWIVGPRLEPPRLFLQGLRKVLEFGVSADTDLEWHYRDDVEQMVPAFVQCRPWGFRAVFQPSTLGRLQGLPKVCACESLSSGVFSVGERADWQRIARLVQEQCSSEGSRFLPALTRSAELATSLGLRSPLPATTRSSLALDVRQAGPRRLLFVSHTLTGTEGAPKVLFEIIKSIKTRFQPNAEIMVLAAADGALRKGLEELGCEVAIIPNLTVAALTWEAFRDRFREGFARVQEFAPDLVFANCSGCFWGAQIASRLGLPSLLCIHESIAPTVWGGEYDPRCRLSFLHTLEAIDRVVFVADSTRQLYSGVVPEERSLTIPNGLDPEEFTKRRDAIDRAAVRQALDVSADQLMISIIGTTTERKGQDVFLREMAALQHRRPELRLRCFIVGARRSPFLTSLQRLSSELGLDEVVTFVEEQPEVGHYFVASDIVAMCSREESAPLVSLEAFAYGVPLISTPVFGLAEQLVHEDNALVFEIEQPGTLALAVERLLAEPELRQAIIDGGFRTLQNRFNAAECNKRHWQEICQVFARHRALMA